MHSGWGQGFQISSGLSSRLLLAHATPGYLWGGHGFQVALWVGCPSHSEWGGEGRALQDGVIGTATPGLSPVHQADTALGERKGKEDTWTQPRGCWWVTMRTVVSCLSPGTSGAAGLIPLPHALRSCHSGPHVSSCTLFPPGGSLQAMGNSESALGTGVGPLGSCSGLPPSTQPERHAGPLERTSLSCCMPHMLPHSLVTTSPGRCGAQEMWVDK